MSVQLPPGTMFAGYQLDAELARGGMGVVYTATQLRPHRRIALKLLAPHLAADPAYRERFLREVDALASLEHPNVVPIYAAGEWEGQLYLAMRFLDGQDLSEILRLRGPMDPWWLIGVLDPIADALDEAHRRGIVHRDVTPANIRLDARGVPYLTDFGLTKRAMSRSELTQVAGPLGTPAYMAPEQFNNLPEPGTPIDALPDPALAGRIDIYALGCVLVSCLTGQPPYPRETYEAALWAHVHAPAPSLRDRRRELPAALDGIVGRALAKNPADRWPSASELLRAVRAALLAASGPAPASSVPIPAGLPGSAGGPTSGSAATRVAPRGDGGRRGAQPGRQAPAPSGGTPPSRPPRRALRIPGGAVLAGLIVIAGIAGLGLGMAALGAFSPTDSARPTGSAVAAASRRPVPTPTATAVPTPTPTPTPEPTPTPTPTPRLGKPTDVARLRDALPLQIRDQCSVAGVTRASELAAFSCVVDGLTGVRYTLYASADDLAEMFERVIKGPDFGSDTSTCKLGSPARGAWGTDGFLGIGGETLGTMACWTDTNQRARVAWTLDRGLVLARIARSDNDLARLYERWFSGALHPRG